MKYFLTFFMWMVFFMAPAVNAEAVHEKDPFQIETGIFETLEPFAGETIIFRDIYTGTDLYEILVSHLDRLAKESDEDRYPLIVLPINALPEELWLELEAEVKNRQGLVMDFVCSDEDETGDKPEMDENFFIFSLPIE